MSDAAPAVERWLAWRYLATRQREGFVSFIAMFSLIGVALGVATLIVVLSVMGGFRQQLLGRIEPLAARTDLTLKAGERALRDVRAAQSARDLQRLREEGARDEQIDLGDSRFTASG